MPRVLNKRTDEIPPDAIYVGRPSKWGNPFSIGDYGTREQVIELYRKWLWSSAGGATLEYTSGGDCRCEYPEG